MNSSALEMTFARETAGGAIEVATLAVGYKKLYLSRGVIGDEILEQDLAIPDGGTMLAVAEQTRRDLQDEGFQKRDAFAPGELDKAKEAYQRALAMRAMSSLQVKTLEGFVLF